jgi:hypothetical protein
VRFSCRDIERDTEARSVPNVDEATFERSRNRAKLLTADAAVIEPGVLVVRTLLATVAALNAGIRQLDEAIQQVSATHPDYFIFSSFPVAGPVMAPRLIVAFGSQRERYGNASQILSLSGIAPVMKASGRQCTIHSRWACPKFLRQTFHEYAGLSIQRCAWARAFYETQKARGKGHHAAVRALAFKWVRIMFRCWQSRQSYHENFYLAAREGRAVPLTRRPPGTPTGRCYTQHAAIVQAGNWVCRMVKLALRKSLRIFLPHDTS